MNVEAIARDSKHVGLLKDGNWQKADFYDLDADSNSVGRSLVITLGKACAATSEKALIYLIQKQTWALGIWQANWENATPTTKEFLQFFMAEKGFTNVEGHLISIEILRERFNNTVQDLRKAPGFELSKNGKLMPFQDIFSQENIIKVFCFDDEWNEQNFFIETEREWVLYHWGLGL